MQSTKTASITNTVAVSADEVRALVGLAAKHFASVIDGQDGVKLVSTDVTLEEGGSASVAIVYEQADAPATATANEAPAPEQTATVEAPTPAVEVAPAPAFAPSIVIPTPSV